jgi:hypothetical protein
MALLDMEIGYIAKDTKMRNIRNLTYKDLKRSDSVKGAVWRPV